MISEVSYSSTLQDAFTLFLREPSITSQLERPSSQSEEIKAWTLAGEIEQRR